MNAQTKPVDRIISDAQIGPTPAPDGISGLPHVDNPESIKNFAAFNSPPTATHGGRRAGAGRKWLAVVAPRSLGPRWYVLQLAARHERRAIRDIAEGESRPGRPPRPGYLVERPMTAAVVLRRGERILGRVPMFYGYAFVRFDALRDDWAALSHCDDVVQVLASSSMTPLPLPVDFVEALVADAGKRLQLGPDFMPVRRLGETLRVVGGAMAGFTGSCVGCDGLVTTVAIQMLGRPVALTLPWAAFEAVA